MAEEQISVTPGSGNVFADLGLPHPEEALAKAQLGCIVLGILRKRRLSFGAAARILKVSPAKLSDLRRGQLTRISFDLLFRFLNALGRDVEIVVRKKATARTPARILVTAA